MTVRQQRGSSGGSGRQGAKEARGGAHLAVLERLLGLLGCCGLGGLGFAKEACIAERSLRRRREVPEAHVAPARSLDLHLERPRRVAGVIGDAAVAGLALARPHEGEPLSLSLQEGSPF